MTRPAPTQTGFTLVELMLTLAVIAIISSLSVVSYRQYVRRANRVDATSALLHLSAAEERYYLQHNEYATSDAELTDPPPAGLGITGTQQGLYEISVSAAADGATVGYVATATAYSGGSQRDDDDCQVFTIDQSGMRGASDADGATSAAITARCWR
jgi:type IV pilus assembly protein PilE